MSYPTLFSTPGVKDFAEAVDVERGRQLVKWGDQRHPDGTGTGLDRNHAEQSRNVCQWAADNRELNWKLILLEEIHEALAESDRAKLREELIQSAAVIAAWISDLDRRTA